MRYAVPMSNDRLSAHFAHFYENKVLAAGRLAALKGHGEEQ
jgi:hypothetical protein